MTIISKYAKLQNFILVWDPIYLLLVWPYTCFITSFCVFLDKFWSNDLDLSSRKVKVI